MKNNSHCWAKNSASLVDIINEYEQRLAGSESG
jgi:hypothetical protein